MERNESERRGIGGGVRQVLVEHSATLVRQTHLPTTIAAGCAGFLSWDEHRGPLDPASQTCYYTGMRKRRTGPSRIEETVKNV